MNPSSTNISPYNVMQVILILFALYGFSKGFGHGNENIELQRALTVHADNSIIHSRGEKITKIVGGVEAEIGRYPYQVALMRNDDERPFCGGTLIAPQWVLTAAHCGGYANRVIIGRHDFSNSTEEYEEIGIIEEIVHPDYDAREITDDYMLIKLKLNSTNTPVSLDNGQSRLYAGLDLTVMGWGRLKEGGQQAYVLREADLDLFPICICKFFFFFLFPSAIGKDSICAKRLGKDSCQGDSGGPLIIKGADATTDVQVGIVSWGVGCAFLYFPGVYGKVASARDFINEHISFD